VTSPLHYLTPSSYSPRFLPHLSCCICVILPRPNLSSNWIVQVVAFLKRHRNTSPIFSHVAKGRSAPRRKLTRRAPTDCQHDSDSMVRLWQPSCRNLSLLRFVHPWITRSLACVSTLAYISPPLDGKRLIIACCLSIHSLFVSVLIPHPHAHLAPNNAPKTGQPQGRLRQVLRHQHRLRRSRRRG